MGIIEALFISDGITKQTILRLDLRGSSTSDKLVNEVLSTKLVGTLFIPYA